MPAVDDIGRASKAAGRGLKATAQGTARASRWVRRSVGVARNIGGAGNTGMMRLLDLHAVSCAGDTLVTIGLAGTIFFNVPAGEARGRVALYLFITMVPFALLAPIVGPVLDRFRHGRRLALATTMLGRAALAWVISSNLDGFALYPAAFGVLALSRTYGVARSAAVPRMLPPGLGLSQAGARASVYGTVAGAIIAPVGVLTFKFFSAQWPLRIAAVIFFIGVIISFLLPPTADSDAPEVAPKVFHAPWKPREAGGPRILSGRLLLAVLLGSAILRAVYGFLLLFLAFAIRSNDAPVTIINITLTPPVALGAVGVALGLGTFLSTAIGMALRIRRPARVQLFCLTALAIVAVWAAVNLTLFTILCLCLTSAIASGLSKLAVDATIQERISDTVRASAFAHSETLLMLAFVAGGAIGLVPVPGWVGVWFVAVAIIVAVANAVWQSRRLRGEVLDGRYRPGVSDRSELDRTRAITDGKTLTGTVTSSTTTPVPSPAPPGYHVYQPTPPGVTDPRAGG
jgi:MFS family permease